MTVLSQTRAVAAGAGLTERIVSAIQSVAGGRPVGLHEPTFRGREWEYVKQSLDTGVVSSVGPFVDRFEADLTAYTGAKHAVAVVNGTAALHVALLMAGVRQGDEVLVPALTFVATSNAVRHCHATPHFVDIEAATLGMGAPAVRAHLQRIAAVSDGVCVNTETGRVIRAMVPMHTFGHPSDIDGLLGVAADFRMSLIEDAAESLGSTYRGRHAGTFGLMGTLSFNGNKTITTGGGGAILTDDRDLARRAKHITTTAKVPHRWEYDHDEVAFNYRMPNLNAALGCAQLEQLPALVDQKRRLHDRYREAFAPIDGVRLITEPEGCRSNYWLQTLLLDRELAGLRDELLEATNDAGLTTRPAWKLMTALAIFSGCPAAPTPEAEALSARLINIPSSSSLLS